MKSMVMHIDGSHVKSTVPNVGTKHALGWGIVALFNDQQVEVLAGQLIQPRLNGCHEMISFVEAALFAQARGYAPEAVTVYTDDERIGYAGVTLHPGNYRVASADSLTASIKNLTDAHYCDATFATVMAYLKGARIHKVRGHAGLVYQERADYLARTGAWSVIRQSEEVLSYPDWLQKGISYYTHPDEPQKTWHAPFVTQPADAFALAY